MNETESFKRPDHPDFALTSELKKQEFSGVRFYEATGDFEFWILGEVVKRVTKVAVELDPSLLYKAHNEVFQLR
jgi:hypothetical protein